MRLWLVVVTMLWLLPRLTWADDEHGKQLFEQGLSAAEDKRWADAARLFEESLLHSDRPATRFNLLLASHELSRPLDVTRHALAFLAYPKREEHGEARARARELLARATQRLAMVTTGALPDGTGLAVDGARPDPRADERIYLLPGPHHLQASLPGGLYESIQVELTAGQTLAWPRQGRSRAPLTLTPAVSTSVTADAAPREPSMARLRTRLAWSGGVLGAAMTLSALGCYLGAEHRADGLSTQNPSVDGYVSASDDYLRLTNAILPLALSGGVLMAGAVAVGMRTRGASLGWTLASLSLGGAALAFGAVLMIRDPAIVVPNTNVTRPTIQAGSLLLSAALPLLTYGLIAPFTRRQKRRELVHSLSSLRMNW